MASKLASKVKTAFGFREDPTPKDYPYRMLLIGETGSGKTSFLNLLCNCGMIQALNHSFDDLSLLRDFHDIELENAVSHRMESKTTGAKIYSAVLHDLKMGIIDTPGFGDSRGMKQDKLNTQSIIDVLRGEEYVNCVCLIINGRQARMSANLRYVLTEITAILPKNVIGNIIVVFTNTADPLDLNFDLDQLGEFFGKTPVKDEHTFNVENPYCRLEKAMKQQGRLPKVMIAKSLKKNFEDTAKVLEEMCTVMRDFVRVHTNDFIYLYEKKQEVESRVVKLLTAYDNQKKIERAIRDARNEAESALKKKTLNTDFTSMKRVEVVELVRTRRHNTLCAAEGCTSNCHDPCNLEKSVDKSAFLSCACMQGGQYCIVCGHHYTHHYHFEQRYETTVKEEQFVDKSMKQKFKEASTMEERARIFKEKLETKQRSSEQKREELSKELLTVLEEFHKVGMTRNYTKVVENQIAVISTRLEGTVGQEAQDLRKTKEKLEKKLKLVKATLNEPFASKFEDTIWARRTLELDQHALLTKSMVLKAYKKMSIKEHPDKGGDTSSFQRVVRAKDILLKTF